MLPNTFLFYLFLGVVLATYYVIQDRWRNRLLLIASFIFYGAWDWRFAGVLLWQILVCYYLGLAIGKTECSKRRKGLLLCGAVSSFGLLGFFKYFNFLNDSFRQLCIGLHLNYLVPHLNIILPLGLSFFTFQSFGYLLDVHWGKIKPEKKFVPFALFVGFFPQIASGPIGRASKLLPQFHATRQFSGEAFENGLAQILWGLFKKVVIADRLAGYVDAVYANPGMYGSPSLLLAAVFFSIQIYCDFSGYTDIAIGAARLFGIELQKNFDFPYFAASINEFWKRWHISLTSWFRDYLYIPLGGNRCSRLRHEANIMIVFLVSGLWHGANWTFIAWGALHGFLQLLENRLRGRKPAPYSSLFAKLLASLLTFSLVTFAWVFFKAPDFHSAFQVIRGIVFWHGGLSTGASFNTFSINILLIALFAVWEAWNYHHPDSKDAPLPVRSLKYASLLSLIALFGQTSNSFIYLQF